MKPDEIKKALGGLLKEAKEKKALEEETRKAKNEEDRRAIFDSVGKDIGEIIGPYIEAMREQGQMTTDTFGKELKRIISESIKIDAPSVDTAGIESVIASAFANLNLPTPQVSVTVAKIEVPKIDMPESMKVFGGVSLPDVTRKSPLPVMLIDQAGKPLIFPSPSVGGGATGGRGDFYTIKDIQTSSGASLIDQSEGGALKVTGNFSITSSATSTIAQLYNSDGAIDGSNPLQIAGTLSTTPGATFYASDAVGSMNVVQVGGVTVPTTNNENNAGYLKVAHANDFVLSVNVVAGTSAAGTEYVDGGTSTGPQGGVLMLQDSSNSTFAARGGSGAADSRTIRVVQATDVGVSVSMSPTNAFGSDGLTVDVLRTGLGLYNGATFDRARNTAGEGNALRVQMANDAVASVYITGASGTTAAALVDSSGVAYSGSNPLPTTGSATLSAAVGEGDAASALRVVHAGNAVASINILQINGNTPATGLSDTNAGVLRTVLMADVVSSTNLATALDHTIDSISAKQVSGFTDSVFVTGFMDSTVVAQARTTNPTSVADGADVRPTADKLGRQLSRPVQVRELIATAYVALSNGTETTLLAAGGAGVFHDLIMVTATNNSTAATQLDIRAVTGGNILHTMYLPAQSGPVGFAPSVPWPQDATNNNWTIDMPDQTGTTVYVSGLFSKET